MQANGMEAALGGEDKHTEPLHDRTRQVMGAMAELTLNGTLGKATGGDAPWRNRAAAWTCACAAISQNASLPNRTPPVRCSPTGPSAAEIEQPKAMATEFSRRLTNPSLRYSRGDGNEPAYRFNVPH
ncbi:MAG: hypothetical protein V4564_13415 [Pseudomonadota bacterium]